MAQSSDPSPLLGESRRASIMSALERDGAVRVSALTAALGVTAATIRRDITQLESEGIVRRVHGGAVFSGKGAGHPVTDVDAAPKLQRIGMLVPSIDYYWPGVIEGAQSEAARRGLSVMLRGSSYDSDDARVHIEHLLYRAHAAGLILAPNMNAPHSADALESLAEAHVPVVLVERSVTVGPLGTTLESVVSDHSQGAALALRHLAEMGHRRIGIAINEDSPTGPHVRRGWLSARKALGVEDLKVVDATIPTVQGAELDDVVDRILEQCQTTGTTALLVHADQQAAAISQRCDIHGLSVPGDLSIVAYDDELAELFTPPLTAVRPPRASIGRAAMDLIAERLRHPERPMHSVVISPSLRIRETTGPPKQS